MKVDDVEFARSQESSDLSADHGGLSELMAQKQGEDSRSAPQRDDLDAIGFAGLDGRRTLVKRTVCAGVVDDRCMMSATDERPAQALDSDAVAAKVMRRIKRRHMAEAKRSHLFGAKCGPTNCNRSSLSSNLPSVLKLGGVIDGCETRSRRVLESSLAGR